MRKSLKILLEPLSETQVLQLINLTDKRWA